MHSLGRYISAGRSLDGDLTITLAVEDIDIDQLRKLEGKELVIDVKKYSEKRSLNANAYFWKVCELIAQKLNSDKDTIYLIQLSKYGVFVDVRILRDALDSLKDKFRYVEDFDDGYDDEYTTARCYFGSSHYNTQEMARLLEMTIQDAHDLGISTWSDEEVNSLIAGWERSTK